MTKGEAPTTAEQAQAPAEAAVTQNTAAEAAAPEQAASAPQQPDQRLNAAEMAAVAAAAAEVEAPVEQEAAAQLASAAEAQAKAEVDFDKKKEKDEDAEAEEAPVDLAMAPEDIADVIAAADGARTVSGAEGEGEASALANDGEGVPTIGLVAAGATAIAAGILIASDDEDEAPNPGPNPDPEPEPEPENVAPEFTSEGTAEVDENVSVDTVVYDAEATDADGDEITYSILAEGDDAAAFEIDPETGEVRFVASPDFETQEEYTITIVATDSEGNATEQEVVITVNDVENENAAPVITSDAAVTVDENIAEDTVVLDVDATDAEGEDITYSILAEGEDADAFTIDADTGEVRFVASPDFETQDSYTITVVATDSEGNATQQEVVFTVTDLDETAVDLDAADNDNNPNTPNIVDAADSDVLFTDDAEVASYTIITNFEEGDQIQFSEGAEVSFTTGPDDANDLQITINEGGVVSEIILDDVLGDDVGFIFDEATAEEAVGFDFFSTAEAAPVVTADVETIA